MLSQRGEATHEPRYAMTPPVALLRIDHLLSPSLIAGIDEKLRRSIWGVDYSNRVRCFMTTPSLAYRDIV